MARKYTSKDTKILIDKHKENLKSLEASLTLPSKYADRIRDCAGEMISSGIFEHIVLDDLKGKETTDKTQLFMLVRYLYLFKRANTQAKTSKYILKDNADRIRRALEDATVGANTFSWLLSSSDKKQTANEACELLEKEINGSYYWNSSKDVLAAVAENDVLTIDDGLNDFSSCIEEYRANFKQNLPSNYDPNKTIAELNNLVQKFATINKSIASENAKTDSIRENIKKAAERMVMTAVLDILKTVPVEELNRDRKGFRTKALRDAGYNTMADIYSADQYQLESVYGLSKDAAYSIGEISKNFAVEARRNAKIKISVDNKINEATKLVEELFKYKQYLPALDSLSKLNLEYTHQVESATEDLNAVRNGVYWIFFSEEKKEKIKKSFAYLTEVLSGDYKKRAGETLVIFKEAGLANTAKAWDDFQNNSISYFNILEEIVPGVLGNDDQLYGLPEDLAREIQDECFFPDGLNCELRRYQEWGVKYILHQERVLLGDEMGLGKTVQAIAAMVSLKNTGASHFIVVCPASVLPNWCKEVASKSKLRVTKVHSTGREAAIKSWIKTGGVAVTTYETTKFFQLEDTFKFDLLVVDEAHFIKNINAARSTNVRQLSTFAKRVLFMTGTALENRVDEMISLIEVLQPDVAKSVANIAFMSSAPEFREKVAGVYYRRKREDVLTELPDLIESRVWCALSDDEEIKLYEHEVLNKNFMGVRRLSWNVSNLDKSCKAQRMKEIVEEAEDEGRKVLIFSFFLDTIRKIQAYLGDKCCNPINGSIPPQRRQEIIDQFNEDPTKTVLCAQIQSGGTGLNIQAASVVIICEPQFKPSIENQAISRAYRMGQARNVLVYRLLCENTVDERLTNLLESKQAIFDAFADKSAAADKTAEAEKEITEATFGKIIEEEIERINAKNGIETSKTTDEAIIEENQAEELQDEEIIEEDSKEYKDDENSTTNL